MANGSTLMIDGSAERAMQAFSALVSTDRMGLCISPVPPEELRSGELGKIPKGNWKSIYISMERSPDAIEPSRIIALTARMNKFMRDNGRAGVVLMDDLTLFYEKNGPETFDRFIARLTASVRENGCTFIARMRPETIPAEKMPSYRARFDAIMER